MTDIVTLDCPNCGAPASAPLGEVETFCEHCGSQLRLLPDDRELEVVRTRENMKRRERVAIKKAILEKEFAKEEMDKWRETAGKVAIAALPIVGDVASRALLRTVINRGGGCGCSCLAIVAAVVAAIVGGVLFLF